MKAVGLTVSSKNPGTQCDRARGRWQGGGISVHVQSVLSDTRSALPRKHGKLLNPAVRMARLISQWQITCIHSVTDVFVNLLQSRFRSRASRSVDEFCFNCHFGDGLSPTHGYGSMREMIGGVR